ncbi:hypothetical protein KAR91_08640 [Candidatus Pacearchaeota archaeon]|nr:hypothetical protein [Candidatus Pacearchaeota archaeon]
MKPSDKEKIIQELLKAQEIRQLYDNYIIKSVISFETWVRNTVNSLIRE